MTTNKVLDQAVVKFSLERYTFHDETEEKAGWILSSNNKLAIKNLMSDIGNEKLNMPVGSDLQQTALAQEFLRGQLTILNYLLEADKSVRATSYFSSEQPYIP